MATIITRAGKGSPLTNAELDANFVNLNTQLGGALFAALNLSDLTDVAQARTNLGLGNVENKSSATIRGELTSTNVTTALGFTPYNATNPAGYITSSALSPYLTTSSAASTYLPLAGGTTTGAITFNIGGSIAAKIGVSGLFSIGGEAGSADSLFTVTNGGAIGLEFSPTAISGRNRILSYNRAATAFVPLNYAASEHNWDVSGTVRMRIDSSGNVLVGTTTALANSSLVANQGVTARTAAASGVTPYLQLLNGNAGTDLKTWRIGGGSAGDLSFETVNDAYSSATGRMVISSAGNVGIGTSSPGGTLHLVAASANVLVNQYSADGLGPGVAIAKSRGTISSPSAVTTGDSLGLFTGGGHNSSSIVYNKAGMQILAAENWTTTANGTDITLATTSIGLTGRSERLRINSYGNVGIATSSPTARLDVNNQDAADTFPLVVSNSIAGTNAASAGVGFNAHGVRFAQVVGGQQTSGTFADGNLRFFTRGAETVAERMRIDSSGNWKLGTAVFGTRAAIYGGNASTGTTVNGSEAAMLLLVDSSAAANAGPEIAFASCYDANGSNTLTGAAIKSYKVPPAGSDAAQFNHGLIFKTSVYPTGIREVMRVDPDGRLSIGSASPPSGLFGVIKANGTVAQFNTLEGIAGNNAIQIGGYEYAYSNTGAHIRVYRYHGSTVNSQMAFEINGTTEAARIDSSGNLLVGTTTNSDNNRVNIRQSAVNAGLGVGAGSGGGMLNWYNNGGGYLATVAHSGATVIYGTGSDYRLKNITGPITNSGAYIDSLNPVEGTWKADGSPFVGLIAHEVQEVSRTAVATGEKDGEQMQGMDYSSAEIIANMLAELKSLRARVAALESN